MYIEKDRGLAMHEQWQSSQVLALFQYHIPMEHEGLLVRHDLYQRDKEHDVRPDNLSATLFYSV